MGYKNSDSHPKKQNQQAAQRGEDSSSSSGSIMDEDKISQLPEPILRHILSLLPQKHAIQTCTLSKSWRYLGLTLPKIEFRQSFYTGKRETKNTFFSVFRNTLHRYFDQNLPIQEFILGFSKPDPESISLLFKWIPIVLTKKGLKMFSLSANNFPLPSLVFQAEALEELFLLGCNLTEISHSNVHVLTRLRTLSLGFVWITDETFDKIISSCPSIQHLVLDSCCGLRAVNLNRAPNLKHFAFYGIQGDESVEIDDDAMSLETISIKNCRFWHRHNIKNNYFFPRLKSLCLWHVHLTTELLNNLSSSFNCPSLEDFQLHHCSGFSGFKLSNRSVKRLSFIIPESNPIEVAFVDAPNMLYFECKSSYLTKLIPNFPRIETLKLWGVHLPTELLNNLSSSNCPCLEELEIRNCSGFGEFKLSNRSIKRLIINEPNRRIEAACFDVANILYFEFRSGFLPSISFTTTSRDWKSRIEVYRSYSDGDDVASTWYPKLHEFLKALSQSQISLDISYLPELTRNEGGGICEPPVVVEHLCLKAHYSSSLLNYMFGICRPRYFGVPFFDNSPKEYDQLAESILKILIRKGEIRQCDFWQWLPVKVCEFSNNQYTWFRLNWRDLS